jgi:hypothetical protein
MTELRTALNPCVPQRWPTTRVTEDRRMDLCSQPTRWRVGRSLLLVALDDFCSPHVGAVRIAADVAQSASLAEQVPALVDVVDRRLSLSPRPRRVR